MARLTSGNRSVTYRYNNVVSQIYRTLERKLTLGLYYNFSLNFSSSFHIFLKDEQSRPESLFLKPEPARARLIFETRTQARSGRAGPGRVGEFRAARTSLVDILIFVKYFSK